MQRTITFWILLTLEASRSDFISTFATALNDGYAKYAYNNKHCNSFPGQLSLSIKKTYVQKLTKQTT